MARARVDRWVVRGQDAAWNFMAASTVPSEIALGFGSGWFALCLLSRPDYFAVSPGYATLAQIAPERGWGTGGSALLLLLLVGWWWDWYWPRAVAYAGFGFQWSILGLSFAVNFGVNATQGLYWVMAATALWCLLRTLATGAVHGEVASARASVRLRGGGDG